MHRRYFRRTVRYFRDFVFTKIENFNIAFVYRFSMALEMIEQYYERRRVQNLAPNFLWTFGCWFRKK